MFTEFKTVSFSMMKLATKEDLEVIRAYNELRDISVQFTKVVQPKLSEIVGVQAAFNIEDRIKSILAEAVRTISFDFPVLRMPFIEYDSFTVDTFFDSATINLVEGPLKEIFKGVYGKAAEFENVFARLTLALEEQERQEQEEYESEQAVFLQTHLKWTGLPKADYKQTGPLKTIAYTPTALRASGLIPPGYELVPIPVLDALVYAGMNTYDIAVGGFEAEKQINQCAKAAHNILKRHPNGGKKCK